VNLQSDRLRCAKEDALDRGPTMSACAELHGQTYVLQSVMAPDKAHNLKIYLVMTVCMTASVHIAANNYVHG
jgi:hypothetical protein